MKKNKIGLLALLLAILLIISAGCDLLDMETESSTGDILEVHFLDVGQADAIFIKKGKEAMLIDAGNNKDGKFVVDYIRKQGIKTLKYLIGTHPHADHIGGMDDVIDDLNVEKILMPNVTANTRTFEEVLDSIGRKNLKITPPKVGAKYNLGQAEFTILAPNSEEYADTNDYSIVIKLVNGKNTFLFTGDAEAVSEREMVENHRKSLRSDVLKVGHHGSTTSTIPEFLNAVKPKVAVISSEEGNSYGHPHREIIEILEKNNIDILRTDTLGTIVLKADGNTIEYINRSIESNNTSVKLSDIEITHIDKIEELVTIKNFSEEDIDLTGWKILSVRGNQEFIFPEYILKSGQKVVISSGNKKGDLDWGATNIWNNTESDPGILYNSQGQEIYYYED